MHDKLFANQDALERADLERYAQDLGLALGRFRAALDSRKHKAFVEADAKVAKDSDITGIPGFAINGYYVSGAQTFQHFKRVIDRALKEAGPRPARSFHSSGHP
jgi:predicted DsbA family dithiol-disulfide isomerase